MLSESPDPSLLQAYVTEIQAISIAYTNQANNLAKSGKDYDSSQTSYKIHSGS